MDVKIPPTKNMGRRIRMFEVREMEARMKLKIATEFQRSPYSLPFSTLPDIYEPTNIPKP